MTQSWAHLKIKIISPPSKRNLTFNLLDPDQIRLTLCYTNYWWFGFGLDNGLCVRFEHLMVPKALSVLLTPIEPHVRYSRIGGSYSPISGLAANCV